MIQLLLNPQKALFLVLLCLATLQSRASEEKKGMFTQCVDFIEDFSSHYINPAIYGIMGYCFLANSIHRPQNEVTLKPNLTYENPLHQKACDTFNEVAQKLDMNCNLGLYSECSCKGPDLALSNDYGLTCKESLFQEPFSKEKAQSEIAYHLVRIKNCDLSKKRLAKLISFPLLWGLLHISGDLCHHLFHKLFKDEYTQKNAYYLKDIQRLITLALKSPITLFALSSLFFSKLDSYFLNKINNEAAQIVGPGYSKP
jgi:hypothetical protein